MEYQQIPCLHSTLSPGVKVRVTYSRAWSTSQYFICLVLLQMQIRGPVLCRLGVLMLKRENVQLLGGEVEDLVVENSCQVLLTRAL